MLWGVASISILEGKLYINTLEHNLPSKEHGEAIAAEARKLLAGYDDVRRVVLVFPQMLDHNTSHINCVPCCSAVEEAISREEARHGRERVAEPPATADPSPAQRVGDSLGDLL